ncbi:hypothetical protein [Rhodovulum sp. PH10]|uniref:hypothetical protein n=1 Tax=Rhodovulum sp. PH10 TaxID=1187851 RepID=UPI00058FE1EE|nr:hypothetical protein [Rhodovulum sp. PH10]
MDVRSEMQRAELEIRAALAGSPGQAMSDLMQCYDSREPAEKDAFVAALIGRLATTKSLARNRSAA